MSLVKSQPTIITTNTIFYMEKVGKVLSFTISNIGSTDATINGLIPLAVGDPEKVFSGESGVYRNDELNIQFVGGSGQILLVYTVETGTAGFQK